MHTTADDPKKYRSEEEVELWKQKDPLVRYERYLLKKNILTESDRAALEKEVQEEIQSAIDSAEKQMQELGDPLDMFDHLYAELPPRLQAQKAALADELNNRDQEDHHG